MIHSQDRFLQASYLFRALICLYKPYLYKSNIKQHTNRTIYLEDYFCVSQNCSQTNFKLLYGNKLIQVMTY